MREFAPGSTKATFDKAIAGLADELQPVLDAVQQGYRAAMQYTTKAKGQLEDHLLLEDFRKQLTSKVGGITSAEAKFFCSHANSAGVRSDLLTQIENVAADPHAPIAEIGNGIAYLLAWVHGPNGLSVPFTLRTKYGPLCFVFLPDSPTFNDFFRISAEDLLEGFELKRTAIVAPRPEALGEMILATASEDTGFGIVWEGSKDFEEIFADLISGELFNEE